MRQCPLVSETERRVDSESALDRMVTDCLDRGLFTVAEARDRIVEPDMRERRGAALVGAALDRWQERLA
jgi:hypothetical protein